MDIIYFTVITLMFLSAMHFVTADLRVQYKYSYV